MSIFSDHGTLWFPPIWQFKGLAHSFGSKIAFYARSLMLGAISPSYGILQYYLLDRFGVLPLNTRADQRSGKFIQFYLEPERLKKVELWQQATNLSFYCRNSRQQQIRYGICYIQYIKIIMKSFSIAETLIYNPTLKSDKKKPIESDIQEAKIVAYHPEQAPIQQKCNTVGMAEGVYEFCRSLMTEDERSANPKRMFVLMDNCCLVEKEYEDNTWLFIKIQYESHEGVYSKYNEDEDNTYIDSIITEEVAFNILDHFYLSFRTFYGPISAYVFVKKMQQLQKVLSHFVPAYQENNRCDEHKKLDISSYIFNSIRALPLDVNSTLKFNYFKNVLQSYDACILDVVIFSNGLLAYSSLPKQVTAFLLNYFYGTGEPYRFQQASFTRKFTQVAELGHIQEHNKYGTFYNCLNFGLGQADNLMSESKLQLGASMKRTASSPAESSVLSNPSSSQDLLGLSEKEQLNFPQVYITKDGVEHKYVITCFMEKRMLFLTFYKSLNKKQQIIFQNRFYFDNISKFSNKISQVLSGVLSQGDTYKFIYCNLNTCTGKSSIEKWNIFVPELRYVWETIELHKEAQIATTVQNHWVYGIHRLNRLLVLMIPSDIPLHKLDEFADKMFKDYFFKAFM